MAAERDRACGRVGVRVRQVSVHKVVEAHLRRIGTVNPALNAVVIRLDEQALEAADQADRVTVNDGELPPLHGIPFTVKDNIDFRRNAHDARQT